MKYCFRLCLIVILMATLTSCASGPMRGFIEPEKTFYSNIMPDIKIKFDSDMEYIGKLDGNYNAAFINGRSSANQASIMTDIFYLGKKNEQGFMDKGVVIIIDKIRNGFYQPLDYSRTPNILEEGKLVKGDKKYQYITLPNLYNFHPGEKKYLESKGFTVPHCMLGKMIAKVCGGSNNGIYKIIYFENLNKQGSTCNSWRNPNRLNKNQLKYLEDFNRHFDEALVFLN